MTWYSLATDAEERSRRSDPTWQGFGRRIGEEECGLILVAALVKDHAREARLDFRVHPIVNQVSKLFPEIRNLIQPGKLEGFERGLRAAHEESNNRPWLAHLGAFPSSRDP